MAKRRRHVFSLRRVNALRCGAQRAARPRPDAPQGWSLLGDEPMRVLAAFDALEIREGFRLVGYQFRRCGKTSTAIYATPADQPAPPPETCRRDETHSLAPPVPPDAAESLMSAITGDGSPWSYLSASLFAREIEERGAMWSGSYWSEYKILGKSPISAGSEPDWNWVGPPPPGWRPAVEVRGDAVAVTLHALCGLGKEEIYRYADRYTAGRYEFTPAGEVIAEGPRGYVF